MSQDYNNYFDNFENSYDSTPFEFIDNNNNISSQNNIPQNQYEQSFYIPQKKIENNNNLQKFYHSPQLQQLQQQSPQIQQSPQPTQHFNNNLDEHHIYNCPHCLNLLKKIIKKNNMKILKHSSKNYFSRKDIILILLIFLIVLLLFFIIFKKNYL